MSSLWRCSVCKKAGLEEDFLFVPVDETHENLFCYDCCPEEALKQQWPIDDVDENKEHNQTDS